MHAPDKHSNHIHDHDIIALKLLQSFVLLGATSTLKITQMNIPCGELLEVGGESPCKRVRSRRKINAMSREVFLTRRHI